MPERWITSGVIGSGDSAAATNYLLDLFADWDDGLRALIAESEDPLIPRPIYALPTGHRWDRVPGITLLGDAAHLMSPFAGAGANLAMLDGAELARAISTHNDLETALIAYELDLFPRSQAAAAESAENLVEFFQPDALQRVLRTSPNSAGRGRAELLRRRLRADADLPRTRVLQTRLAQECLGMVAVPRVG